MIIRILLLSGKQKAKRIRYRLLKVNFHAYREEQNARLILFFEVIYLVIIPANCNADGVV